MYNLYVSFPHHSHHARTSLWSGWWLLCFGTGRKRRMERFLTRLAVQRLPLSNQAWGLARSMRWSWRWWRTTSVDRLPPRTSSQVSVHIHITDRLIDVLFETCWNGFIPECWIYSQFAPGSDLTFYCISLHFLIIHISVLPEDFLCKNLWLCARVSLKMWLSMWDIYTISFSETAGIC